MYVSRYTLFGIGLFPSTSCSSLPVGSKLRNTYVALSNLRNCHVTVKCRPCRLSPSPHGQKGTCHRVDFRGLGPSFCQCGEYLDTWSPFQSHFHYNYLSPQYLFCLTSMQRQSLSMVATVGIAEIQHTIKN